MAEILTSLNLGGGWSGSGGRSASLAPGRRGVWNLRGGLMNLVTGAGGEKDKIAQGALFTPSVYQASYLETVFGESWAARKFISIPVEDMLIRGREWTGEDSDAGEKMKAQEDKLRLKRQLMMAMKGARLYGTSLMVMMTRRDPLHTPLDPERIREGDLVALPVFHRHQASIAEWKTSPFDPDYGEPASYWITPSIAHQAIQALIQSGADPSVMDSTKSQAGTTMLIHASRVLRFEGISPLSSEGWEGAYERDWGLSELASVLEVVEQEITIAQATAQQVQEDSIETIGIEGWRDIITGHLGPNEPDLSTIANAQSVSKSIWGTRYKDVNDTVERLPINFAGRPDLINAFHQRLAAAAGIPITRFLGQSPAGLNSTGDSDMKNYTIHVRSMQENKLTEPFDMRLDPVVARSAGIKEPPKYKWIPLMDLSEQEMADISFRKAEALALLYDRSAMDENEIREKISGDWLFGDLDPIEIPPDIDLEMPPGQPPQGGPQRGKPAPQKQKQPQPAKQPQQKPQQRAR